MKNQRATLWGSASLVLIVLTAGLLAYLHGHQRLSAPGLKTTPLPGEALKVHVALPAKVLNYRAEELPIEKIVLGILPPDTSFGRSRYDAPDHFFVDVNAVLMGTDRTSMHKPEFCLTGAGFTIDQGASREERVPIAMPIPYDLPVMKMVTTKEIEQGGRRIRVRGLYVFWFVTEDAFTARHFDRMWWMMTHMVRTGVLQRWAYVSCFSVCLPGQEDATFDRMKKFMADAVPQFQSFPAAPSARAAAARAATPGS